jgi:hypothetical protein
VPDNPKKLPEEIRKRAIELMLEQNNDPPEQLATNNSLTSGEVRHIVEAGGHAVQCHFGGLATGVSMQAEALRAAAGDLRNRPGTAPTPR